MFYICTNDWFLVLPCFSIENLLTEWEVEWENENLSSGPSCVSLSKSLNISGPKWLHLQSGALSQYFTVSVLLVFGLDNSSLWRTLLRIVGSLESLMLVVAFPSHYHIPNNPAYVNLFWGEGPLHIENYWQVVSKNSFSFNILWKNSYLGHDWKGRR